MMGWVWRFEGWVWKGLGNGALLGSWPWWEGMGWDWERMGSVLDKKDRRVAGLEKQDASLTARHWVLAVFGLKDQVWGHEHCCSQGKVIGSSSALNLGIYSSKSAGMLSALLLVQESLLKQRNDFLPLHLDVTTHKSRFVSQCSMPSTLYDPYMFLRYVSYRPSPTSSILNK